MLRGANSVLYGSDAMTGVVNITTAQGRTRTPETRLSLDGGNFGQVRFEGSVGGVARRVDYFADYAHLQTDNKVENNDYRNDSFASRVGVTAGSNTRITGTLRAIDSDSGSPNAVNFYGLSDDARVGKMNTYAAVSADTQISDRWQSTGQAGRVEPGLRLRQSVGDRHAVRLLGVRQLSRQHGDDHRAGREVGHGTRHPRLQRLVSLEATPRRRSARCCSARPAISCHLP